MTKTQKRIQQIHREFNTASESLLLEVQKIINESDVEKGKRLLAAGFKNAKQTEKISMIDNSLIPLIEHYKVAYPNNKFITEEMVTAICNKYNLVCAPIDKYKGFVPEKNLQQIERFVLKSEDAATDELIITAAWNTKATGDFTIKSRGAAFIHKHIGLKTIPINHPAITWLRGAPFEYIGGGYIEKYIRVDRQSKMICAPQKDVITEGLKKVGKFFFSFIEVTTPDPVVLQPVKGGYLIITAWGDESKDEIVVNETMN